MELFLFVVLILLQCGNFELTCDIFNDLVSDDDVNKNKNSINEVVNLDNASNMEQDKDDQADMINDGKDHDFQLIKIYEQPLKDGVTTARMSKHSQVERICFLLNEIYIGYPIVFQSILDEVDLLQKMSQLSSSLEHSKTTKRVKQNMAIV